MEQKQSFHLNAHGGGFSVASLYYWCFITIAFMFLWPLALIPLEYFFPFLIEQYWDWVEVFPWVVSLLIFIIFILSYFCTVTLDEKEIRLLWLHIPIYKIPISKLKLLCAVGNGQENVLCLTSNSIEEMALWQEAKLLKNYFTRSDVPFIKKKSNWQDILAQQYLNGLRKSPWGVFKDREVILLEMQPVLQNLIRSLYPQLPYKNYTEIRPGCPKYGPPSNMVPCYRIQASNYYAAIQADGIHISTKKKTVFHIPGKGIKTIVRVDYFADKYPYHEPILFVSTETAAELAVKAPQRLYGETTDAFSDSQALLCCAYATRAARRWTIKHQDCCPLPYTQINVTQLRSCYPHAEWIDLSDSWIKGDEI